MNSVSRRQFVERTLIGLSASMASAWLPIKGIAAVGDEDARASPKEIDRWMAGWIERKELISPLRLGRFVEPIYFLLSPISWKPNAGQAGYVPVQVPRGFVTDFASIPRPFWSLLRPDGDYTHAAIIHDFLYWTQSTPRNKADEILKLAMQDLKVEDATVAIIYKAVARFGESAWKENAALKAKGEKRTLRRFPSDPTIRWSDWKLLSDVFA